MYSPIQTHIKSDALSVDVCETLRYMGNKEEPTPALLRLTNRAGEIIIEACKAKACYKYVDVRIRDGNVVCLDSMQIRSDALSKYFEHTKRACMFAATIGIEADRLLFRARGGNPTFALAVQSAGAVAIEGYCDYLCNEVFAKEAEISGLHLRGRFSPGYGDFALEHQKDILEHLDAWRKIGLSLTDGYMMLPTKSVTAFVAMSERQFCERKKCLVCNQLDCEFREV